MELLKFPSYKGYLRAQRRTVRRRRGYGPYFCRAEIEAIAGYSSMLVMLRGICHGARDGLECDEFKRAIPGADVIGTDLFPYSGPVRGRSEVVEWDFSERRVEWVGAFDFVYSNSLDHARDPALALAVWLEQLGPEGRLFVQWVPGGRGTRDGDCFAGDLWDYVCLANYAGRVEGLIYQRSEWVKGDRLRQRGLESVVVVAGKGDG